MLGAPLGRTCIGGEQRVGVDRRATEWHCHGNMPAYASGTDRDDERYRDGVHAIVGRIDDEPPEFHLELAIDGHRFRLQQDQLFEGYGRRRNFVPRKWLEQVRVKVEGYKRPSWASDNRERRRSAWSTWD